MDPGAAGASSAHVPRVPARGGGATPAAALAVATALALFLGQGDPRVALLPLGLALGGALLWAAPLRATSLLFLFVALAADVPQERPASGLWRSPLYPLGSLLFENLHKHTGVAALRFALADVLLVALLLLAAIRSARGATLDARGAPPASAMTAACVAAVAGAALGLARGGDFKNSLWQVRQIAFTPLLVLLFQQAFRTARDRRAVGATLVLAGLVKTGFGLWVNETIARPRNERLPYVTSHADSMVFATGVAMIVALWWNRRTRASWVLLLGAAPVLGLAMYVNNRRLAWVCLGVSLAVAFLVQPLTRLKRFVARLVLLATPAVLLYGAIGWQSNARVFRPVQVARSILDTREDRSAQTRNIENYNLVRTFMGHPLLGQGFGHEYVEAVKGDDISAIFPQYRYIPHNALLGLFAFGGLLGALLLSLPWMTGFFLALRVHRISADPEDRAAALGAMAAVLSFVLLAWGDMGLQSWACVFLVAAALAVTSTSAVRSGAWPGAAAPRGGAP